MDVRSFILPTKYQYIYGSNIGAVKESMFIGKTLETTAFLGYSVVILLLIGLRRKWKEMKEWTIPMIMFFIFSLGPVLKLGGRFLFNIPTGLGNIASKIGIRISEFGTEILNNFIGVPLPYILLYIFFPFFSILRSPSRFLTILTLIIAIFCGFGVKKLNMKFDKMWIVLSVIILLEALIIPFPTVNEEIHDIYYELRSNPEDFAIIEAPIYGTTDYMYYQTVHEKKIVGGTWWRAPTDTYSFYQNNLMIKYLRFNISSREEGHEILLENVRRSNPETSEIIDRYIGRESDIYGSEDVLLTEKPTEKDIEELREHNIRYILLHTDRLPDGTDVDNAIEYIETLTGNICEDKNTVYMCEI